MVSAIEVAIITLLSFAVIIVIYTFVMALRYKNKLAKNTSTRGMNGVAGKTLNLQCPPGQVISFQEGNKTSTRGALVCTGSKTGVCDAFWQTTGQNATFFNPKTTIDVFAKGSPITDLKEKCSGQNSCSWTVPSKSDSRLPIDPRIPGSCLSSCDGILSFIGTYDCVKA